MGQKEDLQATVEELKARLDAKDRQLEMEKAKNISPQEISAQRQVAQDAEQRRSIRANLMGTTKQTKDGRRHYNTGDSPAYVKGAMWAVDGVIGQDDYVPAFTTFSVHKDTIPSVLWKAVDARGNPLGETDSSAEELVDPSTQVVDRNMLSPGTERAADAK